MKLSEKLRLECERTVSGQHVHSMAVRMVLREAIKMAEQRESMQFGEVGDVGRGHRWVRIRGQLPDHWKDKAVAILLLED